MSRLRKPNAAEEGVEALKRLTPEQQAKTLAALGKLSAKLDECSEALDAYAYRAALRRQMRAMQTDLDEALSRIARLEKQAANKRQESP